MQLQNKNKHTLVLPVQKPDLHICTIIKRKVISFLYVVLYLYLARETKSVELTCNRLVHVKLFIGFPASTIRVRKFMIDYVCRNSGFLVFLHYAANDIRKALQCLVYFKPAIHFQSTEFPASCSFQTNVCQEMIFQCNAFILLGKKYS